MHIERPSETHARVVPLAPGQGHCPESRKAFDFVPDRLTINPRVASMMSALESFPQNDDRRSGLLLTLSRHSRSGFPDISAVLARVVHGRRPLISRHVSSEL
jgi:hypothetical protein